MDLEAAGKGTGKCYDKVRVVSGCAGTGTTIGEYCGSALPPTLTFNTKALRSA